MTWISRVKHANSPLCLRSPKSLQESGKIAAATAENRAFWCSQAPIMTARKTVTHIVTHANAQSQIASDWQSQLRSRKVFPAEIAVKSQCRNRKIALGQKDRCDSESQPCSRNDSWGVS